jgi:hypothetical protein
LKFAGSEGHRPSAHRAAEPQPAARSGTAEPYRTGERLSRKRSA